MVNELKDVMIIGGGIAGIQAALDLAERGIKVNLIENKPAIGGNMARLDKTFPTNDCAICILAPKLSECFRHPNIKIYTCTELKGVSRDNGNYKVNLLKHPRYVREDLCINCGDCVEKCPVKVDDEFDMYLRKRKAIYMYYLQGVPSVMKIDPEHCLYLTRDVCRICEKICDREAINFEDKEKELIIEVGAIIIATGFKTFDPSSLTNLGYKKYPNIVTGLEFERMISASGPTSGHLERISDRVPPKKIAFLQCVGSRDIKNNPYCSSVCCMYGTKEAILAHEHDKDVESSIFYIDLRAAGKGFQEYLKRGENLYNINYIKSKISHITEDDDNNLIIRYEDLEESTIKEERFDLVVLATTMMPHDDANELNTILGIEGDPYNFVKTDFFDPFVTSKPGIFAVGSCTVPMDIPQSVAEASGAAAKAAEFILLNK